MNKKIEYTGDWYESMQQMISGFLSSDWDSYKEWYDIMNPGMQKDKELTDNGKVSLGESDYYLIKQELESIFKRRGTITVEELIEYTGDIWIKPDKKGILTYLLIVYIDFYHEDANYRKDLVEAVIKDFEITEKEMRGYRGGWEPDWAKGLGYRGDGEGRKNKKNAS